MHQAKRTYLPAGFAPGRSATTATAARTTTAATAVPATTAARTIAAESATATRAGFPGPCFVYRQRSATEFRAVQSRHRLIRIAVYRHLDKSETARLPCISIFHNLNAIHLAVCGECRIEILLGRLERNVPDIDILQNVLLLCVYWFRSIQAR
jgi:hypothetical protein